MHHLCRDSMDFGIGHLYVPIGLSGYNFPKHLFKKARVDQS